VREPAFWWQRPGVASALLAPFGALYGVVAASRMRRPDRRAGVPVICIGNFTLGGSGKTPTAIAVAGLLKAAGRKPVLLSRGYGGSLAGPVPVDPHRHTAAQVGDEALLLAQAAPTVVSRDRVAGAQAARAQGADIIVMDDGLQNPSLAKDLVIAVVDARRGIGNGCVFPAGPLRAPLPTQLPLCHAVLFIGQPDPTEALFEAVKRNPLPAFHGELVPDGEALTALADRKLLAFAGIGNPEKFYATLADAGMPPASTKTFPDHHPYTAEEAGNLIMQAEHEGLRLVTTAKDHARIAGDPALSALAQRAHVVPVKLKVGEHDAFRALVLGVSAR
jgi:tetraacyldisaccharide 4'-kinase